MVASRVPPTIATQVRHGRSRNETNRQIPVETVNQQQKRVMGVDHVAHSTGLMTYQEANELPRCLIDSVGVTRCAQIGFTPGVTMLDNYPGVTREMMDAIDRSEDWSDTLERVKQQSYLNFKTEVSSALAPEIQFTPVIYQSENLTVIQPRQAVELPPAWQGLHLQTPVSEASRLRIQHIQLALRSDGETTVIVVDLDTGVVLLEDRITVTAPNHYINIERYLALGGSRYNLFVGVDTSQLCLWQTQCGCLCNSQCKPCDPCNVCRDDNVDCDRFVSESARISFEDLENGYFDRLYRTGHSNGVCVRVELSCEIDQLICAYAPLLAPAFADYTVATLLERGIHSYETNRHTVALDSEKVVALHGKLLTDARAKIKTQVEQLLKLSKSQSLCWLCKQNEMENFIRVSQGYTV